MGHDGIEIDVRFWFLERPTADRRNGIIDLPLIQIGAGEVDFHFTADNRQDSAVDPHKLFAVQELLLSISPDLRFRLHSAGLKPQICRKLPASAQTNRPTPLSGPMSQTRTKGT